LCAAYRGCRNSTCETGLHTSRGQNLASTEEVAMKLKDLLKALVLVATTVWVIVPSIGGQRGAEGTKYDWKNEVTIKGILEEVQQTMPVNQPSDRREVPRLDGIRLKLKTEKGIMDVHLGLSPDVVGEELTINKADAVEITGSLVRIEGNEALIAREIAKGNE